MQRQFVVALFALFLAVTPLTAVTATTPTDVTQQEFDREEFTIHVHENGTARWTFSYHRVLANQSERSQFEAYAEEFNGDTSQSYRNFVTRADALTAAGANETGRTMNATGFSKRAYVRTGVNDVGVVEMSFQWANFAAQRDGRLVVGDVFEGGLTVTEDQRLVVTWADALAPTTAEPQPQQGVDETGDALVWRGDADGTQFLDKQPRVVFADAGEIETGTPPATDASNGTTTGGDPFTSGTDGDPGTATNGSAGGGGSSDLAVWPFAFGAIVLVALGGLAFRHGYLDDDVDGGPGTTGTTDGSGGDGPSTPGSDGTASSTTATPSDPTPAPEPAVTDEELLSDEDRVRSLLTANGGRMKQVDIVEETGWSKSKVSMLLSEMEDDDEIHKLRVGRENIISRVGDEPDATRPTFDDE